MNSKSRTESEASAIATQSTPETDLAGKGLVVASLTGTARVFGLVRDIVVSYFLGAGPIADAFFVAFKVPNFFRRLFAEGAFQQAFVPILADYKVNHSETELQNFVRTITGTFAFVLLLISLFGSIFADELIHLFTFGAWYGEERFDVAANMLHVMFPYLGLISLTAFAGSVLNSYQQFAVTAITPIFLSICVIVAAIWAAFLTGHVGYAMAWGVLVAGFLQLVVHLPLVAKLGLLKIPRLSFRHEGVRRVLKLIVPGVYAASAGQINILVGTILCAQLTVGTVSWFYYADRIIQLPMALLAVALQTILLPNLSRLYKAEESKQYSMTIGWGVRIGILIGLPASVALYFIAKPILATIFLRGAFEVADLEMTAIALQAFAVGLLPLVLTRVAGPAYFAREDMHTPFVYATVGVGVNVGLSLCLFRWLGLLGIACATTVAAYVHCGLLLRGLLLDRFFTPDGLLGRFVFASLLGSTAMAAGLLLLNPGLSSWVEFPEWQRVTWLAFLVFSGLAIYLIVVFLCGVRPRHITHRV